MTNGKDPYQVLGISPNASMDEVKAAYKALVRKYHPDQYQDNPLSEFAEEKMAEINAAYDEIVAQRRGGGYNSGTDFTYNYDYNYGSGYNQNYDQNYGSRSYDNSSTYSGGYSSSSASFADIRRMVANGNYNEAESRLESIPPEDRTAEWFFLRGNICYARGWLDEAYNMFGEACRLDPNNAEYNAAFNRMNSQRNGYMAGGPVRTNPSSDACDCCTTLCIADCCCEMMGGDLIRCI
ncbi:MAG: DnaJ domain-containing protein [Ruminococcus sp.]|nr:DnaJ domain-containing protein [Ruminococcus sp.]